LQLLDENCETTKQSLLATLSNLLQPYRFRDGLDKCMSLEKSQREVGGERKRGGKTPKKKKKKTKFKGFTVKLTISPPTKPLLC
jgi:hypothetical protein